MTPAERKALIFLTVVAALGVGTRAVRSLAADVPTTPETRAALARQIAAVDSARAATRATAAARPGGRSARAAGRRAPRPDAGVGERVGQAAATAAAAAPAAAGRAPVDLDTADSAQLERLPRIGPTLARRVIAERDSNGAFGSIEGVQRRVRGIGPGVARALAPHVTFSGTPRLTGTASGGLPRRRFRSSESAVRRSRFAPVAVSRPASPLVSGSGSTPVMPP